MKKVNTVLRRMLIAVMVLSASVGALAQMSMTGFGGGFGGTAAAYQGPGDLALGTGFQVWGGFRAYTAAARGSVAFSIRRASDSATLNVSTDAVTGKPVTGPTVAFCNATTCTIDALIDFAGTACAGAPCAIASGSPAPTWSAAACNGNGGAVFTGSETLGFGVYSGASAPFTLSAVAKRSSSSYAPIFASAGSTGLYWNNSANTGVVMYNGAVTTNVGGGASTDAALRSFAAVFDPTTPRIVVNGAGTSVTLSSSSLATGMVSGTNGFGGFVGELCEIGIITAASSSGDTTLLYNNQIGTNGY